MVPTRGYTHYTLHVVLHVHGGVGTHMLLLVLHGPISGTH